MSEQIRRPPVLHPFFFSAFPILFLFQHNQQEVTWGQVWGPLALAAAGTAALLVIGLAVFRGNWWKAALAVSVFAALFFTYGHVREALQDHEFGRTRYVLTVYVLIGIAALILIVRAGARVGIVTRILNFAGAGLVLTSLLGVTVFGQGAVPATAGDRKTQTGDTVLRKPKKPRDIYYFVFDRYPSNKSLKEVYGYDNTPFLDALRERGLYVADDARANYVNTIQSLGSSLNLEFLPDLVPRKAPGDHWGPARKLVKNHEVGRSLKTAGYRYIHIGSWSEMTRTNDIADVTYEFDPLSEFSKVLWDTTALRILQQKGGGEGALSRRSEHRKIPIFQFGRIEQTARIDGPNFVFAHLLLPHRPYVFRPDGSARSEKEEERIGLGPAFVDQLKFTNRKILHMLDVLMKGPADEDPIIVLSADEGPYPLRWQVRKYAERTGVPNKTPAELRLKYQILNAFSLPGFTPEQAGLYSKISPVNTFRVVFNLYFGTDFDLYPDRSYIFRDGDHRYTFEEVTNEFDDDRGKGPIPKPA